VLDTLPEQSLDDLAALAALICGTPIALITLVDETRQWFKAAVGTCVRQTPRESAFCAHAILEPGLFIVPDATQDVRFADSPFVLDEPHVRFYAGAPLVTADGLALGALCVIDCVPRELTAAQQDALRILSGQVMAQLELRSRTRALIANEIELRRVAVQSREVERDLRLLFATNPLTMWIYDTETLCFLEVNDAAVVRYGYTRDEFLHMSITEIRPPQDVARLMQSINESRTTWRGAGSWRHRLRNGNIIDVEITSHLLTFAGRAASLVVAHDITERKRAEDAQRASEDRYLKLFEASPDGLVVASQNSTCLDANSSMCRMLGYERHEFLGLSAADILVPIDGQEMEPALHAVRAVRDFQGDKRLRRKDGSTVTAEVSATPLPDGTYLGIIRDVTERNEAIAALSAAEERMRFTLESACLGIWDMNYKSGELRWSETMETQYGLKPGSFAGTFEAYLDLIYPEDRDAMLRVIANAKGNDFSVTHRIVWPDGSIRWISVSGRVVVDESGQLLRAAGVSLDITERRNLEDQYQQAQKMEAVGRLAGGVAHDFNNLLTAILGYCELLLSDLPDGAAHRSDLEEIQKAGIRAASLTRQLLAFSRREIIAPALLNLNTVVHEMASLLQRLIGEDVLVQLNLRPGLSLVKADRGQLEQIVMNLSVNARDAMTNGGRLTIETANVELDEFYTKSHFDAKPGSYVALIVSDSGTGMTPEVRARLFEPFFTTKEVGRGTGLGLATVHGIVKQTGGTVNVYSELGKGTSIKVYFPVATGSENVAEPATATTAHTGCETVLVVEDEAGLRELIPRLLRRQGYTVHVAANADDAQRLFNTYPIDVLLTDVVMPGASGPELTARLTAQRPGLKVLYMSGYTEDAIVHHGVLEPDIAFLHKPFTSDSLSRKLREVLDR